MKLADTEIQVQPFSDTETSRSKLLAKAHHRTVVGMRIT